MTENREALPRQGERKGQLRYYLRAATREPWGRKWSRFWAARWFWSAGRLGPVPVFYEADYWRRESGDDGHATADCPVCQSRICERAGG